MTLREHAEKLADAECVALCDSRRKLGFATPDILSAGDAKIIARNVAAALKVSVNPRTRRRRYNALNPQFIWFLIWTLMTVVKFVIERRNQLASGTKPTWG